VGEFVGAPGPFCLDGVLEVGSGPEQPDVVSFVLLHQALDGGDVLVDDLAAAQFELAHGDEEVAGPAEGCSEVADLDQRVDAVAVDVGLNHLLDDDVLFGQLLHDPVLPQLVLFQLPLQLLPPQG